MKFHTIADIFPLIEGDAFADLVDDVRANGVRDPVWLYEGKILDGRNRWRAAQEAGVECPTRDFDGVDPVAFVVSLNLHRRHLDESQRAMVAGRLANLPAHRPTESAPTGAVTQDAAADLLNVGRRSVQRAREVIEHGAPELVQAVESGRVSVSAASKIAVLPKDDQARAVAAGKEHMQRLAKIEAAKISAMRADIEKRRRLNQKRSMSDAGMLEDRTWFSVEYQLDCLESVISKIGPTSPACSRERAVRMATKWPQIVEFFNSIMEHAHARH